MKKNGTAGVAIDDWKLPIFKNHLDKAGYAYTEHPGLTSGTLLLKVEFESASASDLRGTLEAANKECANAK